MYAIDVLERDHENILHFTNRLEKEALDLMDGEDLDPDFLRRAIDFIRKFCDIYHHQKEEDILFDRMVFEIGDLAKKLIKNGMKVEHDLARSYVLKMETSLEAYEEDPSKLNRLHLISYMMSYVHLLRDHASKENLAVYPFGVKNLSDQGKAWVDDQTKKLEESQKTRDLYKEFEDLIKVNPWA